MGGLALGSFGAARYARRVSRPLLAYAALEAFIGVYAVAFPLLLAWIQPVSLSFWSFFEPSPTAFGAFQFFLFGALLLPPTLCMGATLPLLVGVVATSPDETGLQVGRLYGANTLGAVLGAVLAGFTLLPTLGLAATTSWTAATNLALAGAAVALSRRFAPAPPSAIAASIEDRTTVDGVPALLFVAALAGVSSLLYEVAWFRLMVLILGGSAYAFSIMLVSFLSGIGMGGWAAGESADRALQRKDRAGLLRQLAWLQIGVAALSWAAMFLYVQLPFVFVWLFGALGENGGSVWRIQLFLAVGIMTPPAILMGATFPYLVRAVSGSSNALSQSVGLLYGFNTIGAIIGAAGGGLFLLPALHVRGTVLAGVSINLVAAFIVVSIAGATVVRRRKQVVAWGLAIASVLVLIHWKKPPWDPLLMSSGMYQYVTDLDDRSKQGVLDYAVKPFEVLFYEEGLSAVVTVARDRSGENIWLANNGKVDALTETDKDTQVLLAHLPLTFRPDAKRVLVIGLASGITAGSVTLHETPERIDVVEIEPMVVEASHEFDGVNHRPLEDPRVQVHLNDARNHLFLAADGSYDVVSSEPSNPWISGVSNLFTKEFFALGKRKLSSGGVWAQWLQTYSMHHTDVRSLLATFADAFPHVAVFRVDAADMVLLGSDAPLSISAGSLADLFRAENLRRDLAVAGFLRTEDILSRYLFSRDPIERLVGDIELNTDDNMRIEYSAPKHLYEETQRANSRMLFSVAEVPLDAVEGFESLLALAQAYRQHDPDQRRSLEALRATEVLSPDGFDQIQALIEPLEKKSSVR